MTNIPPSLALPDSPELPAEIEQGIVKVFHAISRTYAARNVLTIGDAVEAEDASVKSLRSVIAKHLLAEKRKQILAFHDGASITVRCHVKDVYAADKFVEEINAACQEALRLLSGSSRGGRMRERIKTICEVVLEWDHTTKPSTIKRQCGKPTAYSYPASGGGNMALCEEHARPHMTSAKAISLTKYDA